MPQGVIPQQTLARSIQGARFANRALFSYLVQWEEGVAGETTRGNRVTEVHG